MELFNIQIFSQLFIYIDLFMVGWVVFQVIDRQIDLQLVRYIFNYYIILFRVFLFISIDGADGIFCILYEGY